MSINTSDNPASNEKNNFELNLNLIDTNQEFITGQVLITN